MLSLIYTLIKYTVGYKSSTKSDTDEINDVIARIENAYAEEAQKDKYFIKDDCYYKTGKITLVATDYVLVDDFYVCDRANISPNNLAVGDQVYYSVSRESRGEEHKIRKIVSVIDESWDDVAAEPPPNPVDPQTLTKCIIGKVIERKNRLLTIEPDDISVDLNKVQSEFIPVIGDWLKLESEVEINEESYDLSGDILEIKRIQPLRSKLDIGTVSSYDPIKEVGVIGKDIVFTRRICDLGYIPCVGDKVISDSVESDQGIYTWRSLTVVPVIQARITVECNN